MEGESETATWAGDGAQVPGQEERGSDGDVGKRRTAWGGLVSPKLRESRRKGGGLTFREMKETKDPAVSPQLGKKRPALDPSFPHPHLAPGPAWDPGSSDFLPGALCWFCLPEPMAKGGPWRGLGCGT